MSLNLLRQDKTSKTGVKGKRLRCGWDDKYLFNILNQAWICIVNKGIKKQTMGAKCLFSKKF
jgi:hypothetical protein